MKAFYQGLTADDLPDGLGWAVKIKGASAGWIRAVAELA